MHVRHYWTDGRDAAMRVSSCAAARAVAVDNGHRPEDEGRTWWMEWGHYRDDDGEPVDGGAWPCGCRGADA